MPKRNKPKKGHPYKFVNTKRLENIPSAWSETTIKEQKKLGKNKRHPFI